MPAPSRHRRALLVLALGGALTLWMTAAAQSGQPGQSGTKPLKPTAPKTNVPAKTPPAKAKPAITDETDDPAAWGKEYPAEYQTYLKTVDQKRTKYGGSEALPRTPSDADPRSTVSQSKLEEDPRLKTMWAGYAFSVDFREERGHAYMLEDQTFTQRQAVVKQPGSCMQCHASVYLPYKRLGNGDLVEGFRKMNAMPYSDARKLVQHPVACIDCHDPETMSLRVTRPGFIIGIRELKASQGVKDYDVNKQASQKEMRAFVCGQCHVEYYFKGTDKQLTYPWSKGLKVDDITAYYDEAQFKDWVHKLTGAPALKAQHPEFEMWNQGIHGRSGVTCADCHMPQIKHQGQTITDHQVNSPLLKIEASCTKCHAGLKPDELKRRVENEQDRFFKQRNIAMDALMGLIADLEKAKAAGRSDAELEAARYLQRRAQFYLDFVEAENSTGFHAPQEALRILGDSVNYARQGQLVLRDPAFKPDVKIVSIPTAQPGPNQATAAPAPERPAGSGGR
jgi:nitrite reductase (cytochrome c-552)